MPVPRRHTPYFGQPDYRIYELNKRLQQRTEVSQTLTLLPNMTTTVNFEFPHEWSLGGCTVYRKEKQTCLVANAWSPGFWEFTVDQEVDNYIQGSEGSFFITSAILLYVSRNCCLSLSSGSSFTLSLSRSIEENPK